MLLVTTKFESQNDFLRLEDFQALSLCSDGRGWMVFYNCGPDSGRSQPHKHLQITPYPFATGSSMLRPDAHFPFLHAMAAIPSWRDARALFALYESLIEQCGGAKACTSHNFIMTDSVMLIVPRRVEHFNGAGINACGFAFSLLVGCEDLKVMFENHGLMNVLKHVTFPATSNL